MISVNFMSVNPVDREFSLRHPVRDDLEVWSR